MSAILGETADAAAAEEAALSEVIEERQRAEEARRQAEEDERRRTAAASVEEEKRRRQQGQEHRQLVAQQIEEEQLRMSGLWSRLQESPRQVAPDTGELARLTDAEIRAARTRAEHDLYRPSELQARPASRRWPTAALGVALGLLASGLFWWTTSSGSTLDETTYERHLVAVTASPSPSVDIATRAVAPERARRRADRDRREHGERGHSNVARRASDDADGLEAARDDRDSAPLDISLDDAGELWRVGSESPGGDTSRVRRR